MAVAGSRLSDKWYLFLLDVNFFPLGRNFFLPTPLPRLPPLPTDLTYPAYPQYPQDVNPKE